MSLIKFRAKVSLPDEEDMEHEERNERLGLPQKEKIWVTRSLAIPSEYIYKVVEHSKTKTLVYISETSDYTETLLVVEPFQEVFEKWETSLIPAEEYEEDEVTEEKDLKLG